MREPLVSIVLPVYNGERYLSRSIESCLSQSYPNLELIVVDDASTDLTIDVITSFADPRIRVIANQQNQGLPQSLNIGFAEASGEYLTWTSADNYYAEDAIESLAGALSKAHNAGLVYGSFHLVDESGQIIGKKHCPPPVYLPRENTVGAYFLYRREVRDAVGDYDPDLRLAEDYDYWLRIYRRFPVMLVDSDSYYYRVHDESLTGTSREAEVLSAARLAQLKSVTPFSRLKCTAYCTLNPLAAGLSRSRVGLLLRAPLSGLWRKIEGADECAHIGSGYQRRQLDRGAEGALVDMVTAFDPKRFSSTVVCPEEGHLPVALRKVGVPVEIVAFYGLMARNPLRYFETIYRLASLVRERQAGLIHVNHQYFANYGVALSKVCRKPVIVHLRGVESDAFFGNHAKHIAGANAVICVSNAAKSRFLDYASQHMPYMQVEALSDRTVTVYDGFRPTPIGLDHAQLCEHYGIRADARVVGTVGQVTPEKGLKQFVEATQIVLQAVSDVHFLIVGADPHPSRRFDEQLKGELDERGLGEFFTFTGFVSDAAALLSGMDVSVLASHQDAFPRVVLESLSAGVLMVATKVGGVPEIVEDGVSGLLVPPGDSVKLSEAILHALEMPEDRRQQIVDGGRRSVARFSVERHAEQVQGIYTQVLNRERCMNG